MIKHLYYQCAVVCTIIASTSLAYPALAEDTASDAVLETLRTECYNDYQAQYDAARVDLPSTAGQDINLEDLNLPPALEEQFGYSSEDLAGLTDMFKDVAATMAPYTQQAYLDLAQINIDLTTCYVDHLADEPSLLPQAEQLRAAAQADYDALADYDFTAALTSGSAAAPTVSVAPYGTTSVRVRAYCLDGNGASPNAGEQYYLAGTIDQLQDENLCDVLLAAQTTGETSGAQGTIWSSNTSLRPSSELTTAATTADATDTTVTNTITKVELPQYGGTWAAISNSISNPIAMGVGIVGGVIGLFSILALGMHWLPKPVSITGIVIGVGLAVVGIIAIAAKTAAAQDVAVPSLYAASSQGQVLVAATSTGSFTSLDVTITNLTDQPLTLSTTCLRFIPTVVSYDPDLSTSFDNYDYDLGDVTSGDVSWDTVGDAYQDNEFDEGHNAQRLGTGDVIDIDPPPLPTPPPEPDQTLDLEKLKEKIKRQVDEAKKKFEEHPDEDSLKDFLKEAQKCLAIGCSDQDPMDDVGAGWQKAVDQALDTYQKDPSDLNRAALERAAEVGQMLGSNTDAAVDALIGPQA